MPHPFQMPQDIFPQRLSTDLVASIEARIGTTLLSKYRLDSVLGIGGMAAVYAATHRNTSRVAVKMLHTWLASSSSIQRTYSPARRLRGQ